MHPTHFFQLRRQSMQLFDLAPPTQPERQLSSLAMWETMLQEELAEFWQALQDYKQADTPSTEQLAELTAEGVDVLNVLSSLLLSQGLPLEAMAEAIHQANLRKCVDGKVIRREDGKILKPPGWQPADKLALFEPARAANSTD